MTNPPNCGELSKPALYKKWSFPLRISSVNVTKSAGNCDIKQSYSKLYVLQYHLTDVNFAVKLDRTGYGSDQQENVSTKIIISFEKMKTFKHFIKTFWQQGMTKTQNYDKNNKNTEYRHFAVLAWFLSMWF